MLSFCDFRFPIIMNIFHYYNLQTDCSFIHYQNLNNYTAKDINYIPKYIFLGILNSGFYSNLIYSRLGFLQKYSLDVLI